MPQKQIEKNRQKEINTFSTATKEEELHSLMTAPAEQEYREDTAFAGGLQIPVPKEARDKTVSNSVSYSKWNKLTAGINVDQNTKKNKGGKKPDTNTMGGVNSEAVPEAPAEPGDSPE